MDRALDEVIAERQRGSQRGSRDRRNNYPRDGVRKSNRDRDEPRNFNQEWVHDRFEDHESGRRPTRDFPRDKIDRYAPSDDRSFRGGAKVKIENMHWEINEEALTDLVEKMGRVTEVKIVYDNHDRSKGIAFVTYERMSDARRAIEEFHGANAMGQPIYLSMVGPTAPKPARNPFDYVEKPSRSLFDRIEEPSGRRRGRSASPDDTIRHSDVSKPPPENIDRYVPGQRDRRRSPFPRRGGRDGGRRPGTKREGSDRKERGDSGRPTSGRRPRKTAEELDAEMEDYWGSKGGEGRANSGANQNGNSAPAAAAAPPVGDDDIDMIE